MKKACQGVVVSFASRELTADKFVLMPRRTKEKHTQRVKSIEGGVRIQYIKEKGSITNTAYQQLTSVSRETAKRDLVNLVERSLLVRKGRGRNIHYVFGSNGPNGSSLTQSLNPQVLVA